MKEYHILSLGAGVQSTAMALMSHKRVQKMYLHRSCKPLREVEFKPKEEHQAQQDLNFSAFECEGVCGN